jgi:transcriptional regulator
MYTPSLFAETRPEILAAFVGENPLALIVTADLQASHLPVFFDEASMCLRAHLARANAHWKSLDGADVLAVFSGPSHYISPSWYASKQKDGKVVPTWNYAVVHVRGRASIHQDPAWFDSHLQELTGRNEPTVGSDWKVADAPADYVEGLKKMIVGVEIEIQSIEGKWKVSQNRPNEDRTGVIDALTALSKPESAAMAKLVRGDRD